MKRIYKNNDIQFNLTLNSFPFDEKMVDTIDFKFYTKSKGNYIAKTKADIKDGVIILEWSELSKLERGVLFYSYNTSSFNEEFQDKYHNTSNEVMTEYYLMTEDNIDVEVVFTEWGRIKGEVDNQQDLVKYVDNKIQANTEPIYLKKTELPTKVSAFENDAKYLQEHQDISGKADKVYVDNQLKLKEDTATVDNKLSKKADKTVVEAELSKKANTTTVDGKLALKADKDTVTSQLSTKADKTEIPTKVSQLQNDKNYLTEHQDISGKADKSDVDSKLSNKVDKVSGKQLSTNDYSNADKAEVGKVKDKQNTLVSGSNIKTINKQSILGEGDITVEGGGSGIIDVPNWFKKSLVCYYNPFKQGLTNKEIQEKNGEFILKDFSDNHLDMQMHNFAGEGMSGMNGYGIDVREFFERNCTITVENDTTLSGVPKDANTSWYLNLSQDQTYNSFKCKITFDNSKGNVRYVYQTEDGKSNSLEIPKSGIYTVPTAYRNLTYLKGFRVENVSKLTVEILPLYEDALVFDGVDDYGNVKNEKLKLTDYTVISKRVWLNNSEEYAALASKSISINEDNGGAFWIEHKSGGNWSTTSFGNSKWIDICADNLIVQTKDKYNGELINVGNKVDTHYLNLGSTSNGGMNANVVIYSFILFNRTLTEKEIDWVKYNVLGEESNKQDKLVSGENIKTINNESVLGSGNITTVPKGGYLRPLFEAAGAVFNEQTGYYELNGLTNITEDEMYDIYTFTNSAYSITSFRRAMCGVKARTMLPRKMNGEAVSNVLLDRDVSEYGRRSDFEVVCFWSDYAKIGESYFANIKDNSALLYNNEKLNKILTPIDVVYNTSFSPLFGLWTNLREIYIYRLNTNISFSKAFKLKIKNEDGTDGSLLYMIKNAINKEKDITITLHKDVYDKAMADSEVQNAIKANGHISLAQA